MTHEEEDKELRKLRLYIKQIRRCNTSERPKVIAAWNFDKDFARYVNTATEIIVQARDCVEKLLRCVGDDYSGLTKIERLRLISMAREIRKLDESTEQGLFVESDEDKRKRKLLRKQLKESKNLNKEERHEQSKTAHV